MAKEIKFYLSEGKCAFRKNKKARIYGLFEKIIFVISLIILNALFTRVFNGFVSYKWHTHKTLDCKS